MLTQRRDKNMKSEQELNRIENSALTLNYDRHIAEVNVRDQVGFHIEPYWPCSDDRHEPEQLHMYHNELHCESKVPLNKGCCLLNTNRSFADV